MIPIDIINRPFSSDFITGLMLPDGIFEAALGRQQLNAHFTNRGNSTLSALKIYAESTSNPGIVIKPATHYVASLAGGASSLNTWEVDVSNAPAGKHNVSFIVETQAGRKRIIQRIFVTRVNFNPVDKTFSIEVPEGVMTVSFQELFTSKDSGGCGCKGSNLRHKIDASKDPITEVLRLLKTLDMNDLKDCVPQAFLMKKFKATVVYNPPFAGQYGDLPYQDPWWKVLCAVLAAICFIIAFAIAAVASGGVTVAATAGAVAVSAAVSCCTAAFWGTFWFGIASAGGWIAAGADARDPFRKGQDNTLPGDGELTVSETLDCEIGYLEPIVPGTPYAIGAKWDYTRTTRDSAAVERNYTHSANEVNNNVHVLSRYEVESPDVVKVYQQKEKPFVVKARFFGKDEKPMKGSELFVKCFLQRKSDNKVITFLLQDDGNNADEQANDGVYTGTYLFDAADDGYWKIIVAAQDVNYADANMAPDEAAQIIGGMLLTNQLVINYEGGTCPLVPDGELHVIG